MTEAVNGESIRWTKSSRSLDTCPLWAFIMKSIRSFIIYILTTMWGGTVSVTNGQLVSCRSGLLGALLTFRPFWFLLSVLVLSWSSFWLSIVVFFWCNCSSKLWFCLWDVPQFLWGFGLASLRQWVAVRHLIVGDGCHWTSKYHATFLSGRR